MHRAVDGTYHAYRCMWSDGWTVNVDSGSVATRSQAVARIADRTASQHLWGSRDVIGHMTIWCPICSHYRFQDILLEHREFSIIHYQRPRCCWRIWACRLSSHSLRVGFKMSFCDRTFAAAARLLWNSLPSDTRQPDLSCDQFRRSHFFLAVGSRRSATCVNCALDALLLTYLLTYL